MDHTSIRAHETTTVSYRPNSSTPTRDYFPNGSLDKVQWFREDGKLHRLDGPATEYFLPDGAKWFEEWYVDGNKHRRGGPAYTGWREDGSRESEEWRAYGRLHRVDGPAQIRFEWDGSPSSVQYAIRGVTYPTQIAAAYALYGTHDHVLRVDLAHSIYAPLLTEGFEPHPIVEAMTYGIVTVEGVRAYLSGAPIEWAKAYEEGAE